MNTYTTTQKVFLIIVLIIAGCATPVRPDPAFYNNPGLHIQHDTAVSMNWLAIAGAVTIAFGVAAFMNGQKAATSILAGGVTLLATGIIVTQCISFLSEFRNIAIGSLVLLGILGFFVFAGTALDITGDGKFGWPDIKAVFFKIRRKP
jgi:hypothetical protein